MDPAWNGGPLLILVTSCFIALILILVVLRAYTRFYYTLQYGLDDYAFIIAFVSKLHTWTCGQRNLCASKLTRSWETAGIGGPVIYSSMRRSVRYLALIPEILGADLRPFRTADTTGLAQIPNC